MTSPSTDRRYFVNASAAVKVPCRVATTAALAALSGLPVIDGVQTAQDDRILVKDQIDQTQNGIYLADSGNWTREPDFDGIYDVVSGTLIKVNAGAANAGFWYVTTADPITPDGSMAIAFGKASAVLAVISAFVQTLLVAGNANAFMTGLGFSAFFETLVDDADAGAMLDTMIANYGLANIQSKLGIGAEYSYNRYGGL